MADDTVTYRDVPGFLGYRVGDDGSVWCNWRRVSLGIGVGSRTYPDGAWRRLKGRRTVACRRNGRERVYLTVSLCHQERPHDRHIHRLVLLAFVGPCPSGMQACHNNGDPFDNRLTNLRYDTPAGNNADKHRHGTLHRGEQIHGARLDPEKVRQIRRRRAAGETQAVIAASLGVSAKAVHHVEHRHTWAWVNDE